VTPSTSHEEPAGGADPGEPRSVDPTPTTDSGHDGCINGNRAYRTSAVSAAALQVGQGLLVNAISIPALAYIIRTLGPTAYGEWALASALAALCTAVSSLGLRTTFVRAVASAPHTASLLLAEQLALRMTLTVVMATGVLAVAVLLGYSRVVILCLLICELALLISVSSAALMDTLQGLEQFSITASASLAGGLVLTLLSVVAMLLRTGIVGLSVAYSTGPLVTFLVLLSACRARGILVTMRCPIARGAKLLHEGRSIGLTNLCALVFQKGLLTILPRFLGMEMFGFFSAGIIPADRLYLVPDSLSTAFYPSIARAVGRDPVAARRLIFRHSVISLVISLPILFCVSSIADPLSAILFHQAQPTCAYVMRASIWALFFISISQPMVCALNAAGRYAEGARAGARALGAITVIAIVVIPFRGLEGACWVWVGRYALEAAFLLRPFLRNFAPAPNEYPWVAVSLSAAAILVPIAIRTLCPASSGLNWGSAASAVPIYLGVLLLFDVADCRRTLSRLYERVIVSIKCD